jgi:hypothetical protein
MSLGCKNAVAVWKGCLLAATRNNSLSPEQRSAIARRAAKARWTKPKPTSPVKDFALKLDHDHR